ncbi:mechanosensitive ion channel family protein [Chloroflexota bacterium]
MKVKPILFLVMGIALLLVLLLGFGGVTYAQTPEPEVASEAPAGGETPLPTPTGLLDEVIEPRTPVPTATTGPLSQRVNQLVAQSRLHRTSFLGLSTADWVNLGISLLFVVLGYLIGTWLTRVLVRRLVQRMPSKFDDLMLDAAGSELRWLAVLLALHFGTVRLTFLTAESKVVLSDIYYTVALLLGVRVAWKVIDFADEWYRETLAKEGRADELSPAITALVRIGRVLMVIAAVTVLLSRFGVNVTAFAAMLGLGGLALSLAAGDTIADAISGFIILVDRPFRIGDRVEIQGIGTWGDVVDIGLRTTRIRTRDNRMVIVPNSTLVNSQVVNFTYPDPRYRIQTHVGIAYGTDIETARQVLVDTVRRVDGVLVDEPVDALYIEMGHSSMVFRVRWWIESYIDTRQMFDQVHSALQIALDAAGIESPYPTQTLHVEVHRDSPIQLWQASGDADDSTLTGV